MAALKLERWQLLKVITPLQKSGFGRWFFERGRFSDSSFLTKRSFTNLLREATWTHGKRYYLP
jgi:hypothetical protein